MIKLIKLEIWRTRQSGLSRSTPHFTLTSSSASNRSVCRSASFFLFVPRCLYLYLSIPVSLSLCPSACLSFLVCLNFTTRRRPSSQKTQTGTCILNRISESSSIRFSDICRGWICLLRFLLVCLQSFVYRSIPLGYTNSINIIIDVEVAEVENLLIQ